MGTHSLTYIYDENYERIGSMYLNYDGYPDGVGPRFAEFLINYLESNNKLYMHELAKEFFSHFHFGDDEVEEDGIPEEWEYHIYPQTVKVYHHGQLINCLDWRTEDFYNFTISFER